MEQLEAALATSDSWQVKRLLGLAHLERGDATAALSALSAAAREAPEGAGLDADWPRPAPAAVAPGAVAHSRGRGPRSSERRWSLGAVSKRVRVAAKSGASEALGGGHGSLRAHLRRAASGSGGPIARGDLRVPERGWSMGVIGRGQDGAAVGRGNRRLRGHLRGAFAVGVVRLLEPGRSLGAVRQRGQNAAAVGRGDEPLRAHLRGAHRPGEIRLPERRWSVGAVGERGQNAAAMGRGGGPLRSDLRGTHRGGERSLLQPGRSLGAFGERGQDSAVVGCGDGTVRARAHAWRIRGFRERHVPEPGGRWALSTGRRHEDQNDEDDDDNPDTALRLWEVATGRCVRTFEGRNSGLNLPPPNGICLSADGRYALWSEPDGTLRLWDMACRLCRLFPLFACLGCNLTHN